MDVVLRAAGLETVVCVGEWFSGRSFRPTAAKALNPLCGALFFPTLSLHCRYKMIYDMTQFFWQNGMSRYIEGYVQKINPAKAGKVVGALLDVDAPADFITNLIISVRSLIPVDEVVTEFEERGKLKLLNRFLE